MKCRFVASPVFVAFIITTAVPLAAAPPPAEVARQVDEQLSGELGGISWREPADAATMLRRFFLDTIGQPPTPDDILAFLADRRADRDQRVLQQLLDDPDFGLNWARYWRDVMMARKSEQRAAIVEPALEEFLSEAFNRNWGWDRIARAFITATGDIRTNGATAIFMAQNGKPEDSAAEISRIFCGIQIQCAQCHDHPTDEWTREQFHQFAAFFPRVAVRPSRQDGERTFLVTVTDRPPFRFARGPANNRFQGTLEHYMPDLQNPESPGTLTTPRFFIGGQEVPLGTRDAERRSALAKWLTSRDNVWFARAFVNRLWAELVGHGFYEPVDDLGPERDVTAPATLDLLATAFTESGYDVKWLMATIMSTRAYRQQSVALADCSQCSPAIFSPQRLRADQLFDALNVALGVSLEQLGGGARSFRGPLRGGPRRLLRESFGYDPSDPREEIQGSIAQALAMMNSRLSTSLIRALPGTPLGRMLAAQPSNEDAIEEMYLRTLSRFPTQSEMRTCVAHVRDASSRREAFEDLQWALLNSTEFLYRR